MTDYPRERENGCVCFMAAPHKSSDALRDRIDALQWRLLMVDATMSGIEKGLEAVARIGGDAQPALAEIVRQVRAEIATTLNHD